MAQSEGPSLPLGGGTVGARVYGDSTIGRVKHGKPKRVGTLRHVTYDGGGEEDLGKEEFQYAFELSNLAGAGQSASRGGSGRGRKVAKAKGSE